MKINMRGNGVIKKHHCGPRVWQKAINWAAGIPSPWRPPLFWRSCKWHHGTVSWYNNPTDIRWCSVVMKNDQNRVKSSQIAQYDGCSPSSDLQDCNDSLGLMMQICFPAAEHHTQLLDGTFHNKSRTSLIPKQRCSAYNDKVTEWYEDILTCFHLPKYARLANRHRC